MLIRLLLCVVLLTSSLACFSQQDSLLSLNKKFDFYRTHELQEKIYVHVDRSFHLTGETMWFKLYYIDGTFHQPLDLSKVAYVEIVDKDRKALIQTKISLTAGTGNGSVFLPASLSSGNYMIRAYTRWMRNFSPDFYFHQPITIVNPFLKLGLKPPAEVPRYDVQFFPEGGTLVSGLTSKIGFRAVDGHGEGIAFYGWVMNDANDTVAHFQPLKFGIGSFSFTPSAGRVYKAFIKDKTSHVMAYPMPVALDHGYVIHVADTAGDRIRISVTSKFPSISPAKPYVYLHVHTRSVVVASKLLFLNAGKTEYLLDRKSLGEGISQITLFDGDRQPVCERLYFRQPRKLKIDVHPDQTRYSTRKKVIVDFLSQQDTQMPVEANLSLAVYQADSLESSESSGISDYVWLTSELKGAIESPAYYLDGRGSEVDRATDNLMLTHGWRRFRWEDILQKKPRTFEFVPEWGGHLITGRLTSQEAGPGKRVTTYLSNPSKNIRIYPSRSNEAGLVQFELKDFFGTQKIIVQTNTQLDSTYKIELLSPYATDFSTGLIPEFDFPQRLKFQITERSLHMQVQNTYYEDKNIRFAVPAFDSTSFYGKPDERYWLDDYTRFPTMEEVMREYVPGVMVRKRKGKFHFLTLDNTNRAIFKDNPLVMLDGVPVFDIDKVMALDPRKVKQLEVMTRRYYLGPLSFPGIVSYTTYHGDLSDFEPDARSLSASYEGLQIPREFFSPRYETQHQHDSRLPDSRSLVYWQPQLKTDAQGRTRCEFYTSDVEGKFRIVVQGITQGGLSGTGTFVFDVLGSGSY